MPLPDDFLRELHDRNDIVSVVSTYVPLRRRGKTEVGLCPFHGEKTPSFTVYPETDSFYCFGCGAGGDVISFIKRMENLDYIDAVRLIAERSGMQMPEYSNDATGATRDLKLKILEANREAARFYNETLSSPAGAEGLRYLRENRRLSDTTIRAFGLGFAPNSRSALTDHLVAKGFRPSDLIQANLTFQDKGGSYTDRFRNRVMFPIIDVRGNVIAFGGRIMTDEKPKYLNTSDTLVFKKTNNLFALNRAKNSKADRFILCEGYMDVIALYQAGFDNVVGGLGTALTEEQVKLIRKYRPTVVLCYDADEAGQKAAIRAMKMFDAQNVNTYVLKVPDGKDPDEYIKHHGENGFIKFKALIDSASNEVEYVYDSLKEKYNVQTADGKSAALVEAAHFLSSLSNPVKRDVYAGKISEDMGIRRESLEAIINSDLSVQQRRDKAAEQRKAREFVSQSINIRTPPELKARSGRSARAEEALTAYLMAHPEEIARVSKLLTPDSFSMPLTSRLYGIITERASSGKSVDLSDLSGSFSDEETTHIAKMLARYNDTASSSASPELCLEYANVILEESKKKSSQDLAARSDKDIMDYLNSLKSASGKPPS